MIEPIVFTNAWVVTRDKLFNGTVEVMGQHIVAVYRGSTSLAGAIDLDGDYLIPGLVELHTDNLERHLLPRPNVHWPVLPAILAHDTEVIGAGITSVFDALTLGDIFTNEDHPSETAQIVGDIHKATQRGLMRANHYIHLRCEVSSTVVMELVNAHVTHPLVRLISVMDHAPGQRQFADEDKYRSWYSSRYGFSDGEVDVMIRRHRETSERMSEPQRREIVSICHQRDLPLASHDDATDDHVEQAANEGFTIIEFPTTETAARAARAHDLGVVASAPNIMIGGSHSGNVSAEYLAANGLVDVLSSDYCPSSLIHAAFTLQRPPARWSLPEAIAAVTLTPARLAGLLDRGEIAPGKRADLARIRFADSLPVVRQVWRNGQQVL